MNPAARDVKRLVRILLTESASPLDAFVMIGCSFATDSSQQRDVTFLRGCCSL